MRGRSGTTGAPSSFRRGNTLKQSMIACSILVPDRNLVETAGNRAGLQMWRIQSKDKTVRLVPKGQFGQFRQEDCYMALDTIIKIDGSPSDYFLHVWIGSLATSRDVAMEKMKLLQDSLGSRIKESSVEEEGNESKRFARYYRMSGGIQLIEPLKLSKQINVKEEKHEVRLFWLKGRRKVWVRRVEVSLDQLNQGDVFILEAERTIYQWNGRSASRMEKAKALDLTQRLRDERMNRVKISIHITDAKEGDDPPSEFWKLLGGRGTIKAADEVPYTDSEAEKMMLEAHKLYVMIDDDGKKELQLVETDGKPLHRRLLSSAYCFVLDCVSQMWLYQGRKTLPKDRQAALRLANKLRAEENTDARPSWCIVKPIKQGVEPALFKDCFQGSWSEHIDTPHFYGKRVKAAGKIADVKEELFNVDRLHHPDKYTIVSEDREAYVRIPCAGDEGTDVKLSNLEVWVVTGSSKKPLDPSLYGTFCSAESYIVLYTAKQRAGGYSYVVYYWQGRQCTIDCRGTAALLASDMAKGISGAHLKRVTQDKEPDHFLSHFEGKMRTLRGSLTQLQAAPEHPALYQIRGTGDWNTRAHEVSMDASSLSSVDAFVADSGKSGGPVYVWLGKWSTSKEKDFAQHFARRLAGYPDDPEQDTDSGLAAAEELASQPLSRLERARRRAAGRRNVKLRGKSVAKRQLDETSSAAAEPPRASSVTDWRRKQQEAEAREAEAEASLGPEPEVVSVSSEADDMAAATVAKDATGLLTAARSMTAKVVAAEKAGGDVRELSLLAKKMLRIAQAGIRGRDKEPVPKLEATGKRMDAELETIRQGLLRARERKRAELAAARKTAEIKRKREEAARAKREAEAKAAREAEEKARQEEEARKHKAAEDRARMLQANVRPVKVMQEEAEESAFWTVLGGKKEYASVEKIWGKGHTKFDFMNDNSENQYLEARMFQCSGTSGTFKAREVDEWGQDDLDPLQVILFDTYRALYVWNGPKTRPTDRKAAVDLAIRYISTAPDKRDSTSCHLYVVNAGSEPMHFRTYFLGWDEESAASTSSTPSSTSSATSSSSPSSSSSSSSSKTNLSGRKVSNRLASLVSRDASKRSAVPTAHASHSLLEGSEGSGSIKIDASKVDAAAASASGGAAQSDGRTFYPASRLKDKPLPDGVDIGTVEMWLSDEEFVEVMGMSKPDFLGLPRWKRLRIKKESGMF